MSALLIRMIVTLPDGREVVINRQHSHVEEARFPHDNTPALVNSAHQDLCAAIDRCFIEPAEVRPIPPEPSGTHYHEGEKLNFTEHGKALARPIWRHKGLPYANVYNVRLTALSATYRRAPWENSPDVTVGIIDFLKRFEEIKS